jgi:hypothetical protein
MKIRLMGTPAECQAAATRIARVLDVREQSAPVPNRGDSQLVRVYLEVGPPPETDR